MFIDHYYYNGISNFTGSDENTYRYQYAGGNWYEGYTLIDGDDELDELTELKNNYFRRAKL
jgi:hypothetical protein